MEIPHLFSKPPNCKDCPAEPLFDGFKQRRKENERFRIDALKAMGVQPRVLLLCESAPRGRFVYDPGSDYSHSGLRYNLRQELTPGKTDRGLFEYLRKHRVWIVDCALCPLDELTSKAQRRRAATQCLSSHTRLYLDTFPAASIIAIFPSRCRFLKRNLPDIAGRVDDQHFHFAFLHGLKEAIEASG